MIPVRDLVKRGVPRGASLFLVTGEEAYLRDQAVASILAALPVEVEVVAVDGQEEPELRDLLDDLRMRDLFGAERLIHLKRADVFVKEHAASLVRFLEAGEAVQRLLIEGRGLAARGRKAAPKTGVVGAIERLGGVVVRCDPLFDAPFQGRGPAWQSPLSRWVVERAQELGKRLSMEDAWVLHRMVGNRLRELDAELGKLVLFVADRPSITTDDIERCVGAGRLAPVFEIADAVAERRLGAALEQGALLFERGVLDTKGRHVREEASVALMVIGSVAARLRKVALVQELMRGGEDFQSAAAAVRHPTFFMDRLRAQVEAWREGDGLPHAARALADVERGLKTGAAAPRVLFDRFLVTVLGRSFRKSKAWRG